MSEERESRHRGGKAPDAEPDEGMALPAGWETHESRSTGDVYFVNVVTQEATYDLPQHAALPPGWTHECSRRDGKVFFISPTGTTTFEPPTKRTTARGGPTSSAPAAA